MKALYITLFLLIHSSCTSTRNSIEGREFALTPKEGQKTLEVMNFEKPPSLDPMSEGWEKQSFFWHKPMTISFLSKDSKKVAKFVTKDSASILVRKVDVELKDYPTLEWDWFVERGISSKINENTTAGDDHPIRIILYFEDLSNETKIMEIVWGNYLDKGNYIFVDGYKHYVARGGKNNIGKWFDEKVDLRTIYKSVFLEEPDAKITDIGVFCDSDNTNSRTVAYLSKINLSKN